MSFWDDLRDQSANPSELKRELDLVAVCAHLGIELEDAGGGRWVGACPFHSDENPSFAVWWDADRGYQKVGCWSCDFSSGDVFDLIGAWDNVDFAGALRKAKALVDQDLPRPEPPPERPAVDLTDVTNAALERAREDVSGIRALLHEKSLPLPAEWVRDEFKVGCTTDQDGVVIPHSKHAIKYRRPPSWIAKAAEGSKLTELYGWWRDFDQPNVILCEGETDTWMTAWVFRDDRDVLVLGLPSGAMAHPRAEWLERFVGREVTLLFDADEAGRRAMRNWVDVLAVPALRIAVLQDGEDACSAGEAAVRAAVENAIEIGNQPPAQLSTVSGGYTRAQSGAAVSNFVVELEQVVSLEGEEIAFEVRLPDHKRAFLSTRDLGSDAGMVRWANSWGYVWYGSRKDSQELMRMLMMDSVFVRHTRGTRVAGWHGEGFVFPKTTIGPASYSYVPPMADVHVADHLHLDHGDWDTDVPRALTTLHARDVITPLLGWVAAAALRDEIGTSGFPSFALVGGSGWGKTTLVDEVLRTFGFSLGITLTATTPHAVHSFAASTNSIPVWVDEYRYGARQDSKLALDQTIRDAWDMGSSVKGGLGENRQALTFLRARAPLLITGEDAFSETSHAERMVIVSIPKDGRNVAALQRLRALDRSGFGRTYLEWLHEMWVDGQVPSPPRIPDRLQQSRAVCAWGWELFSGFTRDLCAYDPGEFDPSRVLREHEDISRTPVVIDLLVECLGRNDRRGYPVVWQDQEDVCVRIMDFVQMARKESDVILPGGSRSTRRWLEERFDTEEGRNSWGSFLRLKGAVDEIT